ncbi:MULTISPECIES: hypothetical protein [unclassified Mesorhizobium]|nr:MULTISPECIES: hypothetical protein [unclassified Mesorhizobium]
MTAIAVLGIVSADMRLIGKEGWQFRWSYAGIWVTRLIKRRSAASFR